MHCLVKCPYEVRFVSQMLCHEWAHGAPLLARLLCSAFKVTEWSMLGIASVGIIDVPTSAVFFTAGKGLLLLIEL